MLLNLRNSLLVRLVVACFVLSSGSVSVAIAQPRDVLVVDAEPLGRFEGHEADVYCVAFSPDAALLATGSFDRTMRLWEVESGSARAVCRGHGGKVMAVSFAPGGKLIATGSDDKSVKLWAIPPAADQKEDEKEDEKDEAASEPPAAVAARAAPAEVTEALKTLSGHKGYVQAVAFSPDGKLLASAGGDKTVKLWDVAEGKEARSIEAHSSSVYCLAFSADGARLASGGLDSEVKIWNVADGKPLKVCSGHSEGVFALLFAADGRHLYSGSADRTIRRWDLDTGEAAQVYGEQPGWVCGLGLLAGETTLVSVDYGGHILAWDVASAALSSQRRLEAVIFAAAASDDGRLLALGTQATAILLVRAMPEE